MMPQRDPLVRQARSVLFTLAAFLYAVAVFFSVQKQLKLAPTAPEAVGRITVEGASKLADYLSFGAFLLIVPAGTLLFRHYGARFFRFLRGKAQHDDRSLFIDTISFTLPIFAAPFFFLTTRKEGWALLLPLIFSSVSVLARRTWHRRAWIRQIYRAELAPFHALIMLEAASWILFRYLVTGTRIAHIPTLFLEIFFVAFFVALFEIALIFVVRISTLLFQSEVSVVVSRVALTGAPLLLLPLLGLTLQPAEVLFLIVVAMMVLILPWTRQASALRGPIVRSLLIVVAIPFLLFVFSYAASAAPSWLDLFHRGETLGPASDYLLGKAPYREVFVLHGMLEDGLLDAWLMELFGRDASIAVARITFIAAVTLPLLFVIGVLIFDSIPLAVLTAGLGIVTFVDNQRLIFHLAVVAALLAWTRATLEWRRVSLLILAGVISAIAFFYSLDIGLFAIVGSIIAIPVTMVLQRLSLASSARSLVWYLLGLTAGALPFLLYLSSRSALASFAETSFVILPRFIDAVWSLPYPNLAAPFRTDLSLRALADYLLGEQIRFILNPLVIVISTVVVIGRWRRGTVDGRVLALAILTIGLAVAQRSALGRADFQHQYFAAYFTGPILLILLLMSMARVKSVASTARDIPFKTLLAAGAALVGFVVLWIPDLLNAKLDGVVRYRPRLSQIGYDDVQGEAVRERIERVRYFAHLVTQPGDTIFDFSNQPAFYFFLDRPNATRFYQVPIISPPPLQQEAIDSLEREKPKLLLRGSPEGFDRFDGIPNEIRTAALASYLESNYHYWRTVSGVELWLRRAVPLRATPRMVAASVPKKVKPWAAETLVLPAVGSMTGAGGAEWRSDVVLHNPYAEPMTISLRYAADRANTERPLTLAPYHTQLLRDAAATFFNLPDSRGAIFIRYPIDRKPIVTLQSYDRTRPSSRVTEMPLSSLQTATAGTVHYALSLVGIEQQGDRRVNLGVINVGLTPLRMVIVCRTAVGAVIGVPVHAVVDEGTSYSLVDAPVALGVPFSEGVTVHVELFAGSAIGYASVIDPQTGAHDMLQAVPSSYKR